MKEHGKSEGFDCCDRPSNLTQIGFKSFIFSALMIQKLDGCPQNNRALLLGCINPCALFQSHQWIQTGVTVWKQPIWSKPMIACPVWPLNLTHDLENKANLRNLIAATRLVILYKLDSNHWFFSHVTLKFDWWPRKIIGHLFYITSSFVHHLEPLCEFELQLLSGNAQLG